MPELYPEDQARVDEVLSKGIYKVDRKPFRFWTLMAGHYERLYSASNDFGR
jgi:hypothetical protein